MEGITIGLGLCLWESQKYEGSGSFCSSFLYIMRGVCHASKGRMERFEKKRKFPTRLVLPFSFSSFVAKLMRREHFVWGMLS